MPGETDYWIINKATLGSTMAPIELAAAQAMVAKHEAYPVAGRIFAATDTIAHRPAINAVVPGSPGTFSPSIAPLPADLAALNALGALGQTDAWDEEEYVVLGDDSHAFWDGATWLEDVPVP